jgi:hypothetical protein
MKTNTWRYAEITETAERRIHQFVQERDANQVRAWAHGVHLMWLDLTHGRDGWTQAEDERPVFGLQLRVNVERYLC